MPYNFVADSFHTKKLLLADFLEAKGDFTPKTAVLRFGALFGGLEKTYDDHLRLTGKHVVNFLLVLIKLFSPDFKAEALRANIGSKWPISLQRGPVDPKCQVEGVAPPTILFLGKLA